MSNAEQADWHTYQAYLSWPEGERLELILGIPCEVYPAPFDVKLSADEVDERPTIVQQEPRTG